MTYIFQLILRAMVSTLDLIEEPESHVLILGFLRLLLLSRLGGLGLSSSWCRFGHRRCRHRELAWVSQVLLDGLRLLELDISARRERQLLFKAVDDHMRNGSDRWVANGERDARQV